MNVAFIGFGRRGKSIYGTLKKMNVLDRVGIFDADPNNFVSVAEENFQSVEELFQKTKPGIVIIATPPSTHIDYIRAHLKNTFAVKSPHTPVARKRGS